MAVLRSLRKQYGEISKRNRVQKRDKKGLKVNFDLQGYLGRSKGRLRRRFGGKFQAFR